MTHLDLFVLGPLRVFVDGIPVKSFRSAKTRALLVYLVMESDRPHTRDTLAGLLWPDQPNQTARDNLRQTLAILRKAIGDSGNPDLPLLDITRNTVQFNTGGDYRLDATTFGALIEACTAHRHRHSETCRVCAQNRADAVALYCGDFLDQFFLSDSDPFEEWALVKRERTRESALAALYQLAEFHTLHGSYEQALGFAHRQIELDPWREEAHRQAMRALALDGRLSASLAQFESCRRGLADEMGVEPSQETMALYQAIKCQLDGAPEQDELSSVLLPLPECDLPSPVTPLFGREHELAELNRLLSDPDCRLVSVVGPGGAGKTRLAIAAAVDKKLEFKDGVFFVPLSSIDSSGLLAPTILSILGAPSPGQRDPVQQLVNYLRAREVLLVLDNMEHLLDGAQILAELMRRAPRVALLVTSRERLNLHGEWVLDLKGLEIPEGQQVTEVDHYSAVQLFLESARRGRAVCSFSDEDKAVIVRICRMVEGMPLAIELAAAWVRVLSPRQIAEEIEKGFGFLTTALRDVPERHRSMRAVFEHSWNLLDAPERTALRRLSVFHGAFHREAAEQVSGVDIGLLSALLDKSLMHSVDPESYDIHNVVKQFAQEQLDAGELQDARRRHAECYLGMAEAAVKGLDTADQVMWLHRLEAENANFRAALAWSVEGGPERAEFALRLCGALARSWDMRGYASEGRRWLELALNAAALRKVADDNTLTQPPAGDPIPHAVLIKAFTAAGSLAWVQGDHVAARSFHMRALALCREAGDRMALGTCFLNLGNVSNHQGEYAEARGFHDQALAVYRELDFKPGIARTLLNMGVAASNQGDHASAQSLYEASLAIRRELGDRYGMAIVLGNLAGLLSQQGNIVAARALVEESLVLRRNLGDQYGIAHCLLELAALANSEQEYSRACDLYKQSLQLLKKTGHAEMIASCLESLAEVQLNVGQAEQAVTFCGAADAIREALGTPLPPSRRETHDEMLAQARTISGDTVFERAWQEGRDMTTTEAVAYALESE